jgi:hypothetical protein
VRVVKTRQQREAGGAQAYERNSVERGDS